MELKYNYVSAYPDLELTLRNNKDVNDFIKTIENKEDWCIFANTNLFKNTSLTVYKKIEIIYTNNMGDEHIIFFNRRQFSNDFINIR